MLIGRHWGPWAFRHNDVIRPAGRWLNSCLKWRQRSKPSFSDDSSSKLPIVSFPNCPSQFRKKEQDAVMTEGEISDAEAPKLKLYVCKGRQRIMDEAGGGTIHF